MRFNKRVLLIDLKQKITTPWTRIAIYCPTEIENPSLCHGFDFDLNVYWEDQSGYEGSLQTPKNPNCGGCSYNISILCPRLKIHPEVLDTVADKDKRFGIEDQSHHDNEDFSEPDLDEIPKGIDDEGVVEGEDCVLTYSPTIEDIFGSNLRNTGDRPGQLSIVTLKCTPLPMEAARSLHVRAGDDT
ncbi:hypothetical protein J1N35_000397 [Gossypium stocksii]|uniref:Uncharacterized protein n=1 Tax=Gossypium stocksii TaxID=47602 RepID=A0A9D4AL11_9ROSI|nr:hypothetical protein J1N35_000397 [Gossypium stocksii]